MQTTEDLATLFHEAHADGARDALLGWERADWSTDARTGVEAAYNAGYDAVQEGRYPANGESYNADTEGWTTHFTG